MLNISLVTDFKQLLSDNKKNVPVCVQADKTKEVFCPVHCFLLGRARALSQNCSSSSTSSCSRFFCCPAGAFLLRCFLPRRRFSVTTFFYVNQMFSVVLGGMWDRAAARLTKTKREEGGEGGGGGEGPTVSETRYPPTP